jgi:hypothetical protein
MSAATGITPALSTPVLASDCCIRPSSPTACCWLFPNPAGTFEGAIYIIMRKNNINERIIKYYMEKSERLNLEQMIKETDEIDNTEQIKKLKHSIKIKEDVNVFVKLNKKYKRMRNNNKKMYMQIMMKNCNFLWTNYTNIFNRLVKEELDLNILYNFINTLSLVEDGELSQHDASVKIGQLLKELYIDSAVKRQDKIDKRNNKGKEKVIKPDKNISWRDYKEQLKN